MSGDQGFRITRRIEFADTDASGRAHFAAVLRHVEAAEHECLRRAGVPAGDVEGAWPRVRVECEYLRPLSFGEEITVVLRLSPVGVSSLVWTFSVESAGTDAARGSLTTVLVDDEGRPRQVPREWRTRLAGE